MLEYFRIIISLKYDSTNFHDNCRYLYMNVLICVYNDFLIRLKFDMIQSLSLLDTVSVDPQFLSTLSFCRLLVYIDPQFLSILSFCRYSISVEIQLLSILSFCRFSVSVDTQFLSILSFCRYPVSVDTQFLSILSFWQYSYSVDTQFLPNQIWIKDMHQLMHI